MGSRDRESEWWDASYYSDIEWSFWFFLLHFLLSYRMLVVRAITSRPLKRWLSWM